MKVHVIRGELPNSVIDILFSELEDGLHTPVVSISLICVPGDNRKNFFNPVIFKYGGQFWVSPLRDPITHDVVIEKNNLLTNRLSYSCEVYENENDADARLMQLLMEKE